jgi:CRISPR system Cascade subunit CasE
MFFLKVRPDPEIFSEDTLMFLSLLTIDMGSDPDRPQPGRQWLRNRYHVHQRLCMAFPSPERKAVDPDFLHPFIPEDFAPEQVHRPREKDAGFLFRVDPFPGGRAAILVQSAGLPDWHYAFHNAVGFLAAPPRILPFDPAPEKGGVYRFRIVANPTRKIDTKSLDGLKRNGKRVPVNRDRLGHWLESKGQDAGFSPVKESLRIETGYAFMKKPRAEDGQRIFSTLYEGILEVQEPGKLREAMVSGIGSAKAFGFGLLSLAPLSG